MQQNSMVVSCASAFGYLWCKRSLFYVFRKWTYRSKTASCSGKKTYSAYLYISTTLILLSFGVQSVLVTLYRLSFRQQWIFVWCDKYSLENVSFFFFEWCSCGTGKQRSGQGGCETHVNIIGYLAIYGPLRVVLCPNFSYCWALGLV